VLGGALALVVIVMSVAVGIQSGYVFRALRVMAPFFLIILATHAFFNTVQVGLLVGRSDLTQLFVFPEDWWLIGGRGATLEGLLYGANVVFKTITLTFVIPLGVFTTELDNIIVALVRARVPYKLAFVFSSTLRFVPLLFSELQLIIEAQRLRGLAVESMGFVRRISVYARVAVPLMLSAIVKSQQLEVVLQSKAFAATPHRTYLHDSRLRPRDYSLIAGSAVFLLGAIVAYAVWGLGKFSACL